jgi:hypothetical protein
VTDHATDAEVREHSDEVAAPESEGEVTLGPDGEPIKKKKKRRRRRKKKTEGEAKVEAAPVEDFDDEDPEEDRSRRKLVAVNFKDLGLDDELSRPSPRPAGSTRRRSKASSSRSR